MDAISVVVVDDDFYFRLGLCAALQAAGEPPITVLGSTGDAAEALRMVEDHVPDVLVADLKLRVGSDGFAHGLDLLRSVGTISPETRVLAITAFEEIEIQLQAIHAGVRGFVIKGDQIEGTRIREVVATIDGGGLFYSPHAIGRLHELILRGSEQAPLEPLTRREREVLQLLARGYTNRQIADELVIVEKTVKTHVSNILSKLRLKSRYQVALYAAAQRSLDED